MKPTLHFRLLAPLFTLSLVLPLAAPPLVLAQTTTDPSSQIQSQVAQQLANSFNTGNTVQEANHQTENTATTVNNDNQATVNQTVNADLNTGWNEASRNISIGGNAGMIKTGNALVNVQDAVSANNGATAVTTSQNQTPSTNLQTNTGDHLTAFTGRNSNQTTLVNNKNTTVVNQVTNANANTGHNIVDRNISIGGSAGVIQTGAAGVQTNYLVTANNSVMLVGGTNSNGNSGPGSGASIVRTNTGNNSAFTDTQNFQNQTALQNENNASVQQRCNEVCSVVTGGNQSNRGIAKGGDAGVVHTGNAVIVAALQALVNPSATAIAQNNSSPIDPTATSQNLWNTGTNVTDTSTTHSNNSTTASSTNNATVTQSLTALADTGHNKTNRNISLGGNAGVITTGNAVVDVLMSLVANPSQTTIQTGR